MGSNYNMSKSTKRLLSSLKGEKRAIWKKMMMSAEMSAAKMKFVKLKDIIKPEGE
jgi:hypothetical protein